MKKKVEIRELENTVRVQSPFSHVQLFVTLCTVASQAPMSMGCKELEMTERLD